MVFYAKLSFKLVHSKEIEIWLNLSRVLAFTPWLEVLKPITHRYRSYSFVMAKRATDIVHRTH